MRRLFLRSLALVALSSVSCCGTELDREPTGTSAEPVTVCAGSTVVTGVDVSRYQGTIDWTAVKGAGRQFAYAQVSDGTDAIDSTFDANWAGMKAAGMLRGAYQYFEPGQDAAAQAAIVVQKVGKLGKGDLPVMLDFGVTGSQPAATIVANAKIWIAAVEAGTGRTPVVYTNAGFWNANVSSSDFASKGLFIASWGVSCPNLPSPWTKWVFWQYDDTQTVAGISGAVDTDEFNGTLADLEALAPAPPGDAGASDASTSDAGASDAGAHADGAAPQDASTPLPDAGMTAGLEPRPGPGLWCATSSAPPDQRFGLAALPVMALVLRLARRRRRAYRHPQG